MTGFCPTSDCNCYKKDTLNVDENDDGGTADNGVAKKRVADDGTVDNGVVDDNDDQGEGNN